jgi:hypothetical protein
LLDRLKAVTAKRARTVIDHILKFGQITTEELRDKYGYNHPPRAARDVREQGIPLEMISVTGKDGRKIAAYRFGDLSQIRHGKLGGRRAWPKVFKQQLIEAYGSRCGVCNTEYEGRYLQIDHRVPYEVGGDVAVRLEPSDFMLLCGSCNRAKSWSCENCRNWQTDHLAKVCLTCYWARPEEYAHIALRLVRRLDITWTEKEVADFERLVKHSKRANTPLPDFVKAVLRDRIPDSLA